MMVAVQGGSQQDATSLSVMSTAILREYIALRDDDAALEVQFVIPALDSFPQLSPLPAPPPGAL